MTSPTTDSPHRELGNIIHGIKYVTYYMFAQVGLSIKSRLQQDAADFSPIQSCRCIRIVLQVDREVHDESESSARLPQLTPTL